MSALWVLLALSAVVIPLRPAVGKVSAGVVRVDQAKGHRIRAQPYNARSGQFAQAKLLIAKPSSKGRSLPVKVMRSVAGPDLAAANVDQPEERHYGQQDYH